MTGFDPALDGVVHVRADCATDRRGVLTRIVADGDWSLPPLPEPPRQILHSGTRARGTLRGLHAQVAPHSEAKRIVCLTGNMYWVVLDLRRASGTFGGWRGFELEAGAANALAVPSGFAHGCLSTTDDVNLLIMADRDYAPDHGIGIAWNDPDLAIDWPLADTPILVSEEHAAYPPFADFVNRFGGL